MSTDGGVGEPTRSSTLSYDGQGRPIPAESTETDFRSVFWCGDSDSIAQGRRLKSASSMLDQVLEDSRDLRRQLGVQDQEKLTSIWHPFAKLNKASNALNAGSRSPGPS